MRRLVCACFLKIPEDRLLVLKRTNSSRQFFWVPTTVFCFGWEIKSSQLRTHLKAIILYIFYILPSFFIILILLTSKIWSNSCLPKKKKTNSADSDHIDSEEVVRSGTSLFAILSRFFSSPCNYPFYFRKERVKFLKI